MKVVDRLDAGEFAERGFNLVRIDARGTPASDIQTDSLSRPMLPHRIRWPPPGSSLDRPSVARSTGSRSRKNHRQRNKRVGSHVEVRTLDIDIVPPAPSEQQRGQAVHDDPD